MLKQANNKTGHGSRRFFTLVEVLATLALAGIVLPVALHGISLAMTAGGEAARRREAALLASHKMAELQLPATDYYSIREGDFGEDWPEYRWRLEVEDWGEGGGFQQLTLLVAWRSGGRWREFSLAGLRPVGTMTVER